MTLSRFLRDYVYIALGGNRKGKARRHVNLLATMLLGGLWHGAGWNFVIWGGLHGFYLVINHLWHVVRRTFGMPAKTNSIVGKGLAWLLTFLAVVVAWVFFRAETLLGAELMLGSMLGFVDTNTMDAPVLLDDSAAKWIGALLLIVWLMPNSQQCMSLTQEGKMQTTWFSWRPTIGTLLVFTVSIIYTLAQMTGVSEFLYFQF
jgi:D-alanyl-lipoteichoic acid acyltransferase DltB (MBOAT superfamily)